MSRHLESEMSRSLEREMRIPPREIATERQRELSREAFEMPLFRGEGAVRPGGWGGGAWGGWTAMSPGFYMNRTCVARNIEYEYVIHLDLYI